ncbi:Predicted dehydrogenase (MviM) (PDB:3UUW) [Commensalibacter communis]|uniref:Gfo/Idh/MocA family protein n=1 Tax=Commensalibacter communis TaxID=2972786 RepID=UPI0022FF7EBD|nr:Gfo/Idh/MocA family oxidoreductase [Commensalibacter communis]CAI3954723.1 Predicted dehydrogenase (MviM) (PDB:3UUW) [Commensalibacter communis]CAI3955460.1 Predicted dehydrogenase (MviM) (PDB:3UUW) [Commensalibacter communis]
MKQKGTLGVGVIGSGFMGKAHAWAFGNVGRFFPLKQEPILKILADIPLDKAQAAAKQLGFESATDDWKSLIHHPEIDIVSITTPNNLHTPMALEAINAKKIVYCEKPLATTLNDAIKMTNAAEKAGVITMVGFNYLRNPMMITAKEIIQSGEIGEITGYRGIHSEGFMANAAPYNWRCEKDQFGGALGDIGSHALATARFLLGEFESVCGKLDTIYNSRPTSDGGSKPVYTDDQVNALIQFKDHYFTGVVTSSWLATGWEMHHGFEICGSKGSLIFDQARFNELQIYKGDQKTGRRGFTTIVAGPEHQGYGEFCPAGGHQIGFNDLKTLEVRKLMGCIEKNIQTDFNFRDALTIVRISEAISISSTENRWVNLDEIAS